MSKTVLVISAHPDDETLGVGGTMLRHIANGDSVYWLIVTGMKEEFGFDSDQIVRRDKEIQDVASVYGFKNYYTLNYPAAKLTSIDLPELVSKISQIVSSVRPNIAYIMNRSDVHSDHRLVFEAFSASTKSFRHSYIEKILMYECISETEFSPALPENVFLPNYFVDISAYLESKLEIMKIYVSEMGNHPFPRSEENIRALALFRGATAGVRYAEAFQLLKFIDK